MPIAASGDTKTTKTAKTTKLADEAAKAVLELNGVEIQKVSEPKTEEFQVGEQLRLMEARYGLGRFHFNDDSIVDDQIEPVSRIS